MPPGSPTKKGSRVVQVVSWPAETTKPRWLLPASPPHREGFAVRIPRNHGDGPRGDLVHAPVTTVVRIPALHCVQVLLAVILRPLGLVLELFLYLDEAEMLICDIPAVDEDPEAIAHDVAALDGRGETA